MAKPPTPTPTAAQTGQAVERLAAARLPFHPIVQERFGVSAAEWKVLVETTFPAARTVEAVCMAIAYCRTRKLDIFKKPVHIVPMWSSQAGGYIETVWPGISELRTTAMRTGEYMGADEARFGDTIPVVFKGQVKEGGGWKAEEAKLAVPEWCQITVYRSVHGHRVPFPGPKVYWLESYAKRGRPMEGSPQLPNEMWVQRKVGQIEKCFDEETEVLTDCGFQRFSQVTGRILEVTPQGLAPTDAHPFRQDWDGPMIAAHGQALDFCVTPNHDMLTSAGKMEAVALYENATSVAKYRIPLVVDGSKLEAAISDTAIQLAAIFVCDGYRRPYGKFCVAVSRPYKIALVAGLAAHRSSYTLRAPESRPAESASGTRVIVTRMDKQAFTFDESALEGLVYLDKAFDTKRLLGLSQRQARLLVDTMLVCDGYETTSGARRFYSSRPGIMAAFEVAAVAAGYSISPRRRRISDIGGPNEAVTVSQKTDAPVLRHSASQILKGDGGGLLSEPQNTTGAVWCCTVPSGVIVVRRHGLSMLCGNCAEAAALRKAFPEEIGSDYSADEMAGQVYESVATPAAAEVVTAPVAPTARPSAENYRPKEEVKPAPVVEEEPTFLLKDAEGLSIDEYDIVAYTEAYGRRIDQAVLVDAATVEAFIAHNRDTVEYLVVNRLVEPLDWFETVHAEVRASVAAKAPAVGPGPAPAVIDVEDEGGDEHEGAAPPADDAPPAGERRDWAIAMTIKKDKSPNTTAYATAFKRALAEAQTADDIANLMADNADILATLPANWATTLRGDAETRRTALATGGA